MWPECPAWASRCPQRQTAGPLGGQRARGRGGRPSPRGRALPPEPSPGTTIRVRHSPGAGATKGVSCHRGPGGAAQRLDGRPGRPEPGRALLGTSGLAGWARARRAWPRFPHPLRPCLCRCDGQVSRVRQLPAGGIGPGEQGPWASWECGTRRKVPCLSPRGPTCRPGRTEARAVHTAPTWQASFAWTAGSSLPGRDGAACPLGLTAAFSGCPGQRAAGGGQGRGPGVRGLGWPRARSDGRGAVGALLDLLVRGGGGRAGGRG